MEAASPTRAAAGSRARREEQPQPTTSYQAHTSERPYAPAKAEPISPEARKSLADTVVAFCKSYSLFNQDQMR